MRLPSAMRRIALCASAFTLLAAAAPSALAQDADDRFLLRLSAFNPKASLGFSGNGTVTDGTDQADFEFSEGFDTSRSWRPRGAFGFRFSDRQAVVANYYDYRRNETWDYGGTVLDPGTVGAPGEPIEIPGSSVDGHLALSLASINYEYSFISTDTLQWGLGLGVTWAELEADFSGSSEGTDAVDGQ